MYLNMGNHFICCRWVLRLIFGLLLVAPAELLKIARNQTKHFNFVNPEYFVVLNLKFLLFKLCEEAGGETCFSNSDSGNSSLNIC